MRMRKWLNGLATELNFLSSTLRSSETVFSCPRFLPPCSVLKHLPKIHGPLMVSRLICDMTTEKHLSLLKRGRISGSIFDCAKNLSTFSWNHKIRAHVNANQHHEALSIYYNMLRMEIKSEKSTFIPVLQACTACFDLRMGTLVHRKITEMGLENDVYVGTGLMDMYAKIGDLVLARKVFDIMPNKDIVAWNVMLAGFAKRADPDEALEFFQTMQKDHPKIDSVSLLNIMPAVAKLEDIDACRAIHSYAVRRYFNSTLYNGLIDLYCKCRAVNCAWTIFKEMPNRDNVSWSTMMAGYAHNNRFSEVLNLFDRLKNENIKMNRVAASAALSAAANLVCLEKGTEIHQYILQHKIENEVSVSTSAITMYARCGDLNKAMKLFGTLKEKDVIAWSATMSAFVQAGYSEEALSLFRDMQSEGVKPNAITLVNILLACSELWCLRLGKSIHCYAMKAFVDFDIATATSLITMYAKCLSLKSSVNIFDRMLTKDVVAWDAIIDAYAKTGYSQTAIDMFYELQLFGEHPGSGTMVILLQTCLSLGDLRQGSRIHGYIIKCGFCFEYHVKHALLDMYAKCGSLATAVDLFNRTQISRTAATWNIIIGGYQQNGQTKEAISAFHQMKLKNIQPDLVTFVSILPAAACLTDSREGMALHACIVRMGFQHHNIIGNCLIDLYARCGMLESSAKCFNEIIFKTLVSWNSMLAGYAIHGDGHSAILLFSLMQYKGIQADSISFLNLLSACRHAGLVEEGRELFGLMLRKPSINVTQEHYACMIDLLGRAGLFEEALKLIKTMSRRADAEVWGALLGSSRMHSNSLLGDIALSHLVKLESSDPAYRTKFSGIDACCRIWAKAGCRGSRFTEKALKTARGCSWIEVGNLAYSV